MTIAQLDFVVFQLINEHAGKLPWLDAVMRYFAQDAEYLFFLGILVYWFARTDENRKMVVASGMSACLALAASGVLSDLYFRNRPFVHHHVMQLIGHPANASFPSDHATGGFAIAVSIWLVKRKPGRLWLAAAACIGFSRIWTGVHYPLDVIAGALIGSVSAFAVHRLCRTNALVAWTAAAIKFYERVESRVWPVR
ncbi:phosphatase PAP2 family protein [Cohnella sp. CFH 77786]|uniref:undecaprenyl-diphosphatase n=1 Tax=Cohnella sp. CFH 77786 TaxID=2662265 RepID=UPI001C60BD82|nr:undecaprenyl-diphosphatase [Cohnella sp. CFH 77786]MBW5446013.1 phosphatase PAP2 family protein [Cohnella sp. CFH 77786]